MDLALVAALALALGFLLGMGVAAVRAARLASARRAMAGASGALARVWPETIPARSAVDIMAGRIVVVLGGSAYELPVLPRRASRDWLASLDARFSSLAGALEVADTPEILALLASQTDVLYDLLLEYDRAGVLPARADIDDLASDAEILRATLEVWSALHPLAGALAQASASQTAGASPEPSKSSPAATAGPSSTSTPPSPTSSSSPTSTPGASEWKPTARLISTDGSRP